MWKWPFRQEKKRCAVSIGLTGQFEAIRLTGTFAEPMAPLEVSASVLLPETLHIPPGQYRAGDRVFDLTQPGVYRFFLDGVQAGQRLVCPLDPISILTYAGWLWVYGTDDEGCPSSEDLPALTFGPRILGCSRLATLAVQLFQALGLKARLAAILALRPPNGYSDGHSLVEIQIPGVGWLLYDPSFRCLPGGREQVVSLVDWVNGLRDGKTYNCYPLPGNPPAPRYIVQGLDYGSWILMHDLSPSTRNLWYANLAGIPLLRHDDVFFYPDEIAGDEFRKMMIDMKYRPLPYDKFMSAFYD